VSQWRRTCSFYGKPGGDSGSGVDLDGCKAKFRVGRGYASALTDADIAKTRCGADGEHQHRGIKQTSLAANEVLRTVTITESSIGQQRWLDQHHRA
jgi:hypothetical protein